MADNNNKIIEEYGKYAKEKGFRLNLNREVVERIVKGLLENEKKYGKRYCPCRRVSGDSEKDDKIICPCHYHLKEIEEIGHCLCGLFQK
ncbi:MAG: ferredoxin-thioredoxin reductase catalytic domain-containing protein [bacterium]|nr:ferredoxin-thioredoxin reductase catalytic domain-containing protein [bacterium]